MNRALVQVCVEALKEYRKRWIVDATMARLVGADYPLARKAREKCERIDEAIRTLRELGK